MMKINKENWEFKSFLSCIEKVPKPKQLTTSDYKKSGAIPIVSQDAKLITGYTNHEELKNKFDKPVIVFGDHTRVLKYIDFDFVVGADGVKIIIPKGNLLTKFLYYFLVWHKIPNLGYARHFKLLKDIMIPIPPINTQNYFISLFDKYQDLIFLKQKQLKEFDALEQSVFYKMFGDLVYNDKNWDISDIGSICLSIIRGPFGSALKKEFFVPKGEHTYKVYEQKNAIQCNELIGTYYIDQSRYKNLERFTVLPGDIIMSCAGTIGKLFLIPVLAERGIINQALIRFRLDHNRINEMFFLFLMGRVQNDFDVKGCGLKNLGSVKDLKKMTFGLPPLSLQQSFAQKIEVIEKQKEVVKNEIAQLQALLDSEMDKYFG